MIKKILAYCFVYFVVFQNFVFAQGGASTGGSGTAINAKMKLKNPVKFNSVPQLVETLLDIVLTIAVPIIALAIIYTGFMFIQARGNAKELEEAKRNLVHVLIGSAILLGAYAIALAVVSTINAVRS